MTSANTRTKQMTLIGLMTALLCILAPIAIPLPVSPVPVSLGNLAVCFIAIVLGTKGGFISVLLYLILGMAGLPVFSGFSGGIGRLLGPTGGYLIGYLFLALFAGFFSGHFSNRLFTNLGGALAGMLTLYLLGTSWLAFQLHLDFISALWAGVIPYLPLDTAKMILAAFAGQQLRQRLNKNGFL